MSARILIADDEPLILEVVQKTLELEGWTVDTASNGIDAIKMLDSNEYDVIFSDYQMPEKDGGDLLAYTRSNGFDREFVFITGHADSVPVALTQVFNCLILQKPVKNELLIKIVNACLEIEEYRKKLKSDLYEYVRRTDTTLEQYAEFEKKQLRMLNLKRIRLADLSA